MWVYTKWKYLLWWRKNSTNNLSKYNQMSFNWIPMPIKKSWSDSAVWKKSNSKPTATPLISSWKYSKEKPWKLIDQSLSMSMLILSLLLTPFSHLKTWISDPFNSINQKPEHSKSKTKDFLNSIIPFSITIIKISENNFFKTLKRKDKLNFKLPIVSQLQPMTLKKEVLKSKLNK